MKVLIVASYADSLRVFRGDLILRLISEGHEVAVAAPSFAQAPETKQWLDEARVRILEIPMERTGRNPVSDLKLLAHLFSMFRSERPDAVLAYTVKPVVYGLLAARLAGVERRYALITGLGYAFAGSGGFVASTVVRLYRHALVGAASVMFQNPDDQALFRSLGLIGPGAQTTVVDGSGVNIERFAHVPLRVRPFSFLMIARLLTVKGVREYVAAARRIKAEFPEVRFDLVGWIDENPDAISQDELDAATSDGTIRFHGKLKDVRAVLADCSAFVLPSYREGVPRTVLEAMATGRAIITTDAPGCRETVQPGENGYLVAPKSVDELVDAMRALVSDVALCERMGMASRKIAERKFSVDRVNDHMLREMNLIQRHVEPVVRTQAV